MDKEIITKSAIGEKALKELEVLVKYNPLFGSNNIYEFGVYKGGSALLIASILKEQRFKHKFRLIDSFEGLKPEYYCDKDNQYVPYIFNDTNFEEVVELFKPFDFVEVIKGTIPNILSNLPNEEISFAHVDVDLYLSCKPLMEFLWPKMIKNGTIVFDDYGTDSCCGLTLAVDEFCKPKNIVITNRKYQGAYIIK